MMNKTHPQTKFFAAVVALSLVVALPRVAQAQCELPAQPEVAAAATTTAQAAAVTAMTTAIIAAVEATTTIARAAIVAGMEVGWLALRDRLNQYWEDQQEALQGQAAQLNAGQLDQTRQLGSLSDAQMVNQSARQIQQLEYEARRQFVNTDEGCRFDTTAGYLGRAMSITRTVAAGGANEIGAAVNNRVGTAGARGPAADNAARALRARRLFCDPANNGGNAACLAEGGAFADAHVLPSRTLLGRPTLDLQDERTVPAVNDLVRNIIGYEVPQPMVKDALRTSAGQEGRMAGREVAAQMDAAGGLIWGIAAERMPAGAAPEVEAMRMRLGNQPSPTPSEYEIRKQVVEQLWTPAYYTGLQDAENATSQKQIYLRAYSVMQMYKLIEKMEKISTVYAIQTSNMIEKYGRNFESVERDGSTPGTGNATPAGGGATP